MAPNTVLHQGLMISQSARDHAQLEPRSMVPLLEKLLAT